MVELFASSSSEIDEQFKSDKLLVSDLLSASTFFCGSLSRAELAIRLRPR
jgi:hypothetical protein